MNGSLGFIFVVGIIGLCICLPASFSVVLSPSDSVLFGGAGGEEIRGWDWRRRGRQAFMSVLVEQLPEASAGGDEAGTATHAFFDEDVGAVWTLESVLFQFNFGAEHRLVADEDVVVGDF